jgi:phosphoinositide-3-kinase, regulatory subunit 4
MLIIATNRNNVYAYDLNTMTTSIHFQIPFHFGIITAFAVDSVNRAWIIVGTSKGTLSLVDLRFGLILKSWAHPSSLTISKLSVYPPAAASSSTLRAKRVLCSAGDNELCIWDVETAECKEVFCARSLEEKLGRYARTWKAKPPPDQSVMKFLDRVPTNIDYCPNVFYAHFFCPEANFILTAGSDKKIRFWDLVQIERSVCVGKGEGSEHVFSSHKIDNITFNHEKILKSATKSPVSAQDNLAMGSRKDSTASLPLKSQLSVSAEKSFLFHVDTITQLTVIEFPYPMMITCGRDGIVKVWK